MRRALPVALLAPALSAGAQAIHGPSSVTAGSTFSIATEGSGKAALLVSGPGGALRREVTLGQTVQFTPSEIFNAGHYLVVLTAGATAATAGLDVLPAPGAASLSFLARPSRLPVGVRSGVSGTAFVFDTYGNLISRPVPVAFALAAPEGSTQARTVPTRNGVAWTTMDAAPRQGRARFTAEAGGVRATRIIDQVPGDPCGLVMTARPGAHGVQLETAPVRDCGGNPIPDGTVVTFTETYGGGQSTVDAPVKQGTARAEMPAIPGARFSAASGVVAGNEIRWGGGR